MKTKHTARTLKYFRDLGYYADMVERFIPGGQFGTRRDYAGIVDILAMKPFARPICVQSTGTGYAAHLEKMLTAKIRIGDEDRLAGEIILKSGFELCLIGWRKIKVKRGGKAMIYSPRIKFFKFGDFMMGGVYET